MYRLQYVFPNERLSQHFNTQQTSAAAKAQEEEEDEAKRKKSETKLSGASCFAICQRNDCTCDMLKQLPGEVLQIIHDYFHVQVPDSPVGLSSDYMLFFLLSTFYVAKRRSTPPAQREERPYREANPCW